MGWWGLLLFLSLGIGLETLHGFKIGGYLDPAYRVRRDMWTLAHAHGTLFALVNVAFAAGLPAMLTTTLWARLGGRVGLRPALIGSLLLTGVANIAIGLTPRLGGVLALRAVAGLAMAGFVPLAFESMNAQAPAGSRGRVAGFGSTAMMAGNVIGPLLGAWLAVHGGLAATFWLPGACLLVAGLALAARRPPASWS